MAVSQQLAEVLAAGRTQFNARVAEVRRRYPSFESGAFAAFLEGPVDQLVQIIAATAPHRVTPVAVAAFEVGLELVAQGLAGPGSRNRAANLAWSQVMPRLVALLAAQPFDLLGTVTNAALHVEKTNGARLDEWLQLMAEMGPQASGMDILRQLGVVLAWRAGLAHFRAGAIDAANQLPEHLALNAFGAAPGSNWLSVRRRLIGDPWWAPGRIVEASGRLGFEVGQFSGFGGRFHSPPELRGCADGFVVRSGNRFSFLVADAFGAVFHAATQEEFEEASEPSTSMPRPALKGATLVLGTATVDLDLPETGIAIACNRHTVAVTSHYTFAIRLLPRALGVTE